MRTNLVRLAALALATVATPAIAQDAPADLTVSGSATVVSDYRFRGISQTSEDFTIQGGLSVNHASGLYAGVWGSGIDEYVAYGSDTELDLFAGYKVPVGDYTIDVGVLYYVYPGNAGGSSTDFFEPYAKLSGALGPVSATLGVAYAPSQKALAVTGTKDDNLYLAGDFAYALGNVAPVTLKAHLGYTRGRSVLSLVQKDYVDWSIGADYTMGGLTFNVSYVDTDVSKSFVGAFEDNTDPTVLVSVTAAF